MDAASSALRDVLLDARRWLARPDAHFDWSSWGDAEASLREIDGWIAALERGRVPSRLTLTVSSSPRPGRSSWVGWARPTATEPKRWGGAPYSTSRR